MNYCSPEEMGIKSEDISEYINSLEESRLSTHNIIIMRKGKIVCEAYWKPFDENFYHRQYSISKSFVAIAMGFLEQDGLVELDAPISKYFPNESKVCPDENLKNQTVRDMLMMSTSKFGRNWFIARHPDRVKHYFENDGINTRPSGVIYQYDSCGSFILGALIERAIGKPFMEYLRDKLFNKIGVSEGAYCLECPGGHSWGDSGVICTARDLLLVAQFMLQKGKWNGEQLLNEEYAVKATSNLIDNSIMNENEYDSQGYGYQIWRTYDNSFFFNGMGCQFAICVPDKDIVFVYNGDNQGNPYAKKIIIDNFFNFIVRRVSTKPIKVNKEAEIGLKKLTDSLMLMTAKGEKSSEWVNKINNKTYKLKENEMGITKLRFSFDEDGGVIHYTNDQGDKEIPFGICKNIYSNFPQTGYSDNIGSVPSDVLYRCAASGAWTMPNSLHIKIQIIDRYFGKLNMKFGFVGNRIGIQMKSDAEDFLKEYWGLADGVLENE